MAPQSVPAAHSAKNQAATTQETEFSGPVRPDAAAMADQIVAQALRFCAQKMGAGAAPEDLGAAQTSLRQGNSIACQYYLYSVAGQVAHALGALDNDLQAVYCVDYDAVDCDAVDCDAMSEDMTYGAEDQHMPMLYLIARVQRKTAALDALIAALDRALVRACREMLGQGHLARLLDVQILDDHDMERRAGCAALFASLHYRPIEVWHR